MKENIIATVVYLIKDNQVWLAEKTRKIGVGFLNGYGGKFEPTKDHDLIACSMRETKQECGVGISRASFEKVAIVDFHNMEENGSTWICKVHFYLVKNFKGVPKEIKKDGGMINPHPYNMFRLPISKMMPADRNFVHHLMRGKKVIGEYFYGPKQKELIKGWNKIVDSLPE